MVGGDFFGGRVIRDLISGLIVKQKVKREPENKPSAGTDADSSKEKTVGLLFLAVLFSLVFWDSYWFLSKFLLLFVIVYVGYIVAKSRS
jgi:hypothetical protein